VWLDLYSSGSYSLGEPSATVKTSAAGSFSTSLNVGPVPVGSYQVDAAYTPPPFQTAVASAPVTVTDTSTLGAISSALSSISTAISNLKSDVDTSFSNLQSHIDSDISDATSTITNAISGLQTDIDSKLGVFSGGDTVASLLYNLQAQLSSVQTSLSALNLPTVTSGDGTCTLTTGGGEQDCTIVGLSKDSSVTVSALIAGGNLESGASVLLCARPAGASGGPCNYSTPDPLTVQIFSCGSGTCDELVQGYTGVLAGGEIGLELSCGGLTNTCNTPYTVQYTFAATTPV
jgi:hypothetical protein